MDKAKAIIDGKDAQVDTERRVISIATKGGVKELKAVLDQLQKAGIAVEGVELRRPTLDDVFLTLTGHSATAKAESKKKGKS
jgi:ABC-2 type transport system ATP-binding protein